MWKMFEGKDRFNNPLYYVCNEEKQQCVATTYYGIHSARNACCEANAAKKIQIDVVRMPQSLVTVSPNKLF